MEDRPKVVDLAQWRRKRRKLQAQEDYIGKLCHRCQDGGLPGCCSPADLRRLAEIQRQVILDLLGEGEEGKPEGGPQDGSKS